ncbi:MAG: leucine-rich repeat domain-containing protein, partial [Clostridia bacterium]|nr:leucine-rich repeat domain-containing protein [Clostridia bacterium]
VHLSYTDNVTHIAWTQVADADYYEIWRSVEMGEYEQIMTTELLTGTTYDETVTDLTAACAYKVRAVVNQNGTPVYGEFGDAVAISRGAAVADFAAAYDEAKHAVVLTWTEPENATGYVLNLNGTELEQPVGATFHEDYAINYEETRVYTITAVYENGTMTSEEITVTIPANPWTYEVENGEAKVTGYTGTLTENLVIPAEIDGYTVMTIGEGAFANRTDLTGMLTLPETLKDIRASAFNGCTGLTGELVIPDSVEDIGASAFAGWTGLTSVKLSASLDWIRMDTFSGCTGLDGEVIIPEGVYEIAGRAFANCSALDRVVIPSTVTFVEASAFSGVTLTEIEIHANLSEGELDNLSIAEGCTIYGYAGTTVEAYANENGYTFVALAGEAPALPETGSGFEYWVASEEAKTATLTRYIGAANEGIVIPSEIDGYTVTVLYEGLFYQRNDLSGDIVIPDTVTEIFGYAFYGCTGLNGSLTIPASVTTIHENAFTGAAFTEMTVLGSKYPDL